MVKKEHEPWKADRPTGPTRHAGDSIYMGAPPISRAAL
jgi:hypothetical protein